MKDDSPLRLDFDRPGSRSPQLYQANSSFARIPSHDMQRVMSN